MDKEFLSSGSKVKKSQGRKHPCLICGKMFNFTSGLSQHHSIVHLGIKNAKCKECGEKFATDTKLVLHMRKAHGEKGERAICDVCGKTFASRAAMLYHNTLNHLDESYRCGVCGKKTPNMKLHMKKHEKKVQIKCDACGYMFEQAELLNMHKKVVHDQDTQTKTDDRTCSICGTKFPDTAALEIHSTVHKPTTERINCDLCEMSFLKINSYGRHRRTVHNIDQIPCDKCDKKFLTKRELIEHRRTPHIAQCNFCVANFSKKADLLHHNQLSHAQCNICQKFFRNMEALVKHQLELHPGSELITEQITVDVNPPDIDEKDVSEEKADNIEDESINVEQVYTMHKTQDDPAGSFNKTESSLTAPTQTTSVRARTEKSFMDEFDGESEFGIKLVLVNDNIQRVDTEKVLGRHLDQKFDTAPISNNPSHNGESSFKTKLIMGDGKLSKHVVGPSNSAKVQNIKGLKKCGDKKLKKKKLHSNQRRKVPHQSAEKLPTIEDLLKSGEEILNKKLFTSQIKKGVIIPVIIPKNNGQENPLNQEMNISLDLEQSSYQKANESIHNLDEGTSYQWNDDVECNNVNEDDIEELIKIEEMMPSEDEGKRLADNDSRQDGHLVLSFSQGNGPITKGLSENEFKLLVDTVNDIIAVEKSRTPPKIESASFESGKSTIRCGDRETVEWLKPLARVLGFNARLQYDLRYLKGVVPYPASRKRGKDILEQIWSANNLLGTVCLLSSEVKGKELIIYIEVDETVALRLEALNCQNGESRLSCGANSVVFREVKHDR